MKLQLHLNEKATSLKVQGKNNSSSTKIYLIILANLLTIIIASFYVKTPPVFASNNSTPASLYQVIAYQDAEIHQVNPTYFVNMINELSSFQNLPPQGIAGLTPAMAALYNVDPLNPKAALEAAASIMQSYLTHYAGDYSKAIAAYYAGPGEVDNAIQQYDNKWFSRMPVSVQNFVITAEQN